MSLLASISTTRSNFAPSSLFSVRQYVAALSNTAPVGANGRPRTYSIVFSSTATKPARAPASIAMLHTVIRPSIDSARMADPPNSIV
jgi:hypothetical protein